MTQLVCLNGPNYFPIIICQFSGGVIVGIIFNVSSYTGTRSKENADQFDWFPEWKICQGVHGRIVVYVRLCSEQ